MRTQISGFLFLSISLFYGYVATGIPSLPIDEFEAMNARSLPFFLSGLGIFLSSIMIFRPSVNTTSADSPERLLAGDWSTVILLLLAVVAYGFALDWIGFLAASALFLAVGFLVLGERRLTVVVGVSVSMVVLLWLALVPGLGIYLAPGRLYLQAFG